MAGFNQLHVRFASELAVPPADRQNRSLCPRVAQVKGRPDRRSSFDLFWRWDKLSSAPFDVTPSESRPPSPVLDSLVVLEETADNLFVFNTSEETQPHGRQAFSLTGSMTLSHALPLSGNKSRFKHFGSRDPTFGSQREITPLGSAALRIMRRPSVSGCFHKGGEMVRVVS